MQNTKIFEPIILTGFYNSYLILHFNYYSRVVISLNEYFRYSAINSKTKMKYDKSFPLISSQSLS